VALDRSSSIVYAFSSVLEEALSLLGLQGQQSIQGTTAGYQIDASTGKVTKV